MPLVALVGCFACVMWLLSRDVKERPEVSPAAWIVTAWALIYASRPVTSWFADASVAVTPESFDEGNVGEALTNLALIVTAVCVLVRRRVRLPEVIGANTWLFIVYLFWVQSVLWSDEPVITLKRLFKDLGNIAMVLVVLSDKNPAETIRAVILRCAYVCVPVSVVLIRYYPSFGRSYIGYKQDQLSFVGVTENKNTLGMLALVSVIFLLWDLLERGRTVRTATGVVTTGGRVLALLSGWYLLMIADSVTSLVCAVFGSALLLMLSLPYLKRSPARIEAWGISAALVVWALTSGLGLHTAFLGSLGRDTTLTTRTDMWPALLSMQDQPLLGAGFNTFWTGRRLLQVEQTIGNMVIQAHNGYLDTYLNGGLIGLGLLVGLLGVSYWHLRQRLALGALDARIRFAMLFVAIVHNNAEATFFKLSLLWFVTMYALLDFRRSDGSAGHQPQEEPRIVEKFA